MFSKDVNIVTFSYYYFRKNLIFFHKNMKSRLVDASGTSVMVVYGTCRWISKK